MGKNGRFAQYTGGTFFTQQMGDIFEGASILLSILFMGLSFLWFMVAMYAIVDLGIIRGRSKYTLYVRESLGLTTVARNSASILTCSGLGGRWCSP